MADFDLATLRTEAEDLFTTKWMGAFDFAKMLKAQPSQVKRKKVSLQKTKVKKRAKEWLCKNITFTAKRMQFRFLSRDECIAVITLCSDVKFEDCESWLK